MASINISRRQRISNYTQTNIDESCRGFDNFQDCIFFHSPVMGILENMEESPEKDAMLKKYEKKCTFFPCRALSLLQPGRGKIILPNRSEEVKDLWNFYKEKLELNDDQVIWFEYSGRRSMEYDLMHDAKAVAQLQEIVDTSPEGSDRRKLFIFCNRPEITDWATDMGLEVLRDTREWREEFGFKDILHPRPTSADAKSFLETIMPEGAKVPVPRGFNCSTTEELLRAAKLMKSLPGDPITMVCLKPLGASDGDGIEFVSLDDTATLENYSFPMGDISIEEKLRLDKCSDGSIMTIVTHYLAGRLLGPSCDQLLGNAVSATAFIGNVYPSLCPVVTRQKCEEVVLDIMKVCKPKGPGGYDFLFQDGKMYLADVNGGRFNGGMYPKAFHKQYASHDTSYVSFKSYNPKCTLDECMETIRSNGWEFKPIVPSNYATADDDDDLGSYGIFPLVHLRGCYGSYIAVAPTREESVKLMKDFMALDFMLLDVA